MAGITDGCRKLRRMLGPLALAASLLAAAGVCAAAQDATSHPPARVPLWNGAAPLGEGRTEPVEVWITVHRPTAASRKPAPAIVICPGGGYGMLCVEPEGHGIARWLAANGIVGVVLEYRLPQGRAAVPLLDAQRAIRTVRAGAADWGVDAARVGIIGFSAGGHLALCAGTLGDDGDAAAADAVARHPSRPDAVIGIYPVVSMGALAHTGSRRNLLGESPSPALVERFSPERQVTPRTPPIWLAHAEDDSAVAIAHSALMHDALRERGVRGELLRLPRGGHGLDGYQGPMWDAWQTGSLAWLRAIGFADAPR